VSSAPWQKRIQRAELLAGQHPFAREILGFYIELTRFHERLYLNLEKRSKAQASHGRDCVPSEFPKLVASLETFLTLAQRSGPSRLADLARELMREGSDSWPGLLNACWLASNSSTEPQALLLQAFLQPFAQFVRNCTPMRPSTHMYSVCPFCDRKPGLAILRQQGDGARRSLLCSFCHAEWEFRRVVCPRCGEEENGKLPVYIANDFGHIRVECCDTCKTYIKSVDLTKNGLAEPVVDEIASVPLDLWAQKQGYSKLQRNLLGM
jgi:FdhE protein